MKKVKEKMTLSNEQQFQIGTIILKSTGRNTQGFLYDSKKELKFFLSNRHFKDVENPRVKKTNKLLKIRILNLLLKKFSQLNYNGLILMYDGYYASDLIKSLESFGINVAVSDGSEHIEGDVILLNLINLKKVAFNGTRPKKFKKKFKKQIFPYSLYFKNFDLALKHLS